MVYNNLRFFFSFDLLSLSQNFQGFFFDYLAKINPLRFLSSYIIPLATLDATLRLQNFVLPS